MARISTDRKASKAAAPRQPRARSSTRGKAKPNESSGYRQKVRAKKPAERIKRGGCLPDSLMLLLAFASTGTFLFLKSQCIL